MEKREKKRMNKCANSHFEFLFNKKILNSKRSQGHIEIILSFIIFIGFLLFIFIFLNPFAKTKETSYIMDNIQKSIINEISDDVGKLSVITNGTSCYQFTPGDYDGDYLEVDQGDGKFIIYFNEMFSDSQTKKDCSPLNYTLGTYSIEKMIIYDKIEDLKSNYTDRYDGLKTDLGITNDFFFEVRDLVGVRNFDLSVEYNKNIPTGIDIEAREIPIRIIKTDGTIIERKLYIRAW